MDRDLELVRSSFSGLVTRQAVTVRLEIYRLEDDPKWVLEVVNEGGTSTVWDDLFDSDAAAYDAFEATVEQRGHGRIPGRDIQAGLPDPALMPECVSNAHAGLILAQVR